MKLQLVWDKKAKEYKVRDGKKQLGTLYGMDYPETGPCWAFDVQVQGLFTRSAYFYSSPESAKEWIPKEVIDRARERELYDQASSECC